MRLAIADGKVVVNPSREVRVESPLDMVLAGCGNNKTVMIEMDGDVCSFNRLYSHTNFRKFLFL